MKIYQLVLFLVIISGILYANPYQTATVVGVTLQYRTSLDSNNLECILTAPTTGWVAVGFNPSNGMMDGNFIFGYVVSNTLSIRDDWGTAIHSHASDISLGGTDNIMNASGTETAGVTEFSFNIPLHSGDSFDRALSIGSTYPILLAYGAANADNFTSIHADRGATEISIVAPVSNQDHTASIDNDQFGLIIHPNPFHSITTIEFDVKTPAPVKLNIYNLRGQLVKSYGEFSTGKHSVLFDSSVDSSKRIGNGVYLCSIENDTEKQMFKMILAN